jgi:hypothetical protein
MTRCSALVLGVLVAGCGGDGGPADMLGADGGAGAMVSGGDAGGGAGGSMPDMGGSGGSAGVGGQAGVAAGGSGGSGTGGAGGTAGAPMVTGGTAGTPSGVIYKAIVTDEISRAWVVIEGGGVEGFDTDTRVTWAAPYVTGTGSTTGWCAIRDGSIVKMDDCFLGADGTAYGRIWGHINEFCYEVTSSSGAVLYCKQNSVRRFNAKIADVALSRNSVCWVLADGSSGCSNRTPDMRKSLKIAMAANTQGGTSVSCNLLEDGSIVCNDGRTASLARLKDKVFAGPYKDVVLSQIADLHALTADGKIVRFVATKNMYGEIKEEWRAAKPDAVFKRGSLKGALVSSVAKFREGIELVNASTDWDAIAQPRAGEVCGITEDGRGWGCFVIE